MAKSESSQSGGKRQLLAILEGRTCPNCSEGVLERDTYKSKRAVVCGECGTPQAQVWSPTAE